MSFHDATAMPPLLIRPSRAGEHAPDVLLAHWLPLDKPLDGRLWCDAASPTDRLFGNYVDFPMGCDAPQAIHAILKLWQGGPDPVSAWLDGEHPSGEATLAPPSSLAQDHNGKALPRATLTELPGGGGRMFLVSGEPGATLLLNDEASHGETRTIAARDGHIACLRRTRYADPEWTVIPDLGPAGTYWTFSEHDKFAAMAAVALYLAETHAQGGAPDDALAVLAHAALRLRHLGRGFRERVVGILAHSPTEDLDVIALTWCIPLDGTGIELLPNRTGRMCEMLLARHPTYNATLDCLVGAMGRIIHRQDMPAGPHAEALIEASKTVCGLHSRAIGGRATVVFDRAR